VHCPECTQAGQAVVLPAVCTAITNARIALESCAFCPGMHPAEVAMNLIFLLMAFCVGMAMSIQAAVNTQLAASIGANSVVAALVSFACGTIVLAGVALSRGGLGPTFAALAGQPLWKFAGGFL